MAGVARHHLTSLKTPGEVTERYWWMELLLLMKCIWNALTQLAGVGHHHTAIR